MFNVYAGQIPETGCKTLFYFNDCKTLVGTIQNAISTLNALAVLIAVLFLAYGGIKYITASGNKEKATEAKELLTQVLIGLAVVLLINVILSVLMSLTGSGGAITTPASPSFPTATT